MQQDDLFYTQSQVSWKTRCFVKAKTLLCSKMPLCSYSLWSPKECLSTVEPALRPRNTLNCLLKRRGEKQIDVIKQRNGRNRNRCESRERAHAVVTFSFSVRTIMTSSRRAEQTRPFLNVLIWAFLFSFSAGIYMTHSSCTKYSFIHRQRLIIIRWIRGIWRQFAEKLTIVT